MAKNIAEDISYYLHLPRQYRNFLATIRQWEQLKVGFEEDGIWIKGFTALQLEDTQSKNIPFSQKYYSQGGRLFQLGKLLPSTKEPALLWTSIQQALPLELPILNHNFFGTKEKLSLRLIPTEAEQSSAALCCDLEVLQEYVEKAPAIRLEGLKWCIINQKKALVIGTPILPIQGEVFWENRSFLLPAGYTFEYTILSKTYQQQFNPEQENWMVLDIEGRSFEVSKKELQVLSISSVRAV